MSRSVKKNRNERKLRLESLESRQMMSASPWEAAPQSAPAQGGTLSSAALIGDPSAAAPVKVQNDGPFYGTYGRRLVLSMGSLLQNDSGAAFRIVEGSFRSKAGGTVEIRNGLVIYNHPTNAVTNDSFTYTVKYLEKVPFIAGSGYREVTKSATVSVVTQHIPLTANNDNLRDLGHFVFRNQTTIIHAEELTRNDIDPERKAKTVIDVYATSKTHGQVVKVGDKIYYTPNKDYLGPGSFEYVVKDADGWRRTAVVEFNVVRPVPVGGSNNSNPNDNTPNDGQTNPAIPEIVARNDVYTVQAGQKSRLAPLANDFDPQGDRMYLASCSQPKDGTVRANDDGSFEFTPNPNFSGQTSFDYSVRDSKGNVGIATVTINVVKPPIAFERSFGYWEIVGTGGNDQVMVTNHGPWVNVTVNGETKSLGGILNIRQVIFGGGAGDDKFENHTGIKSLVYGGIGNDTLIGGTGADELHGQEGNDHLNGRGGSDVLFGEAGDDQIYGGADADTLRGGLGNDRLFGGLGADLVLGDEGNDLLMGEAGDDRLYGGAGNDLLYGHDGNDLLDGELGDDMLYGNFGRDRLVSRDGIAGNDKLFGQPSEDWFDAPQVEIKNG